jgi:hypothetical protein
MNNSLIQKRSQEGGFKMHIGLAILKELTIHFSLNTPYQEGGNNFPDSFSRMFTPKETPKLLRLSSRCQQYTHNDGGND